MSAIQDSKVTIDITEHLNEDKKRSVSNELILPIDRYFLAAAGASLLASVALWFLVDQASGLFVGLWVPSILALWAGIRIALLHHTTNSN